MNQEQANPTADPADDELDRAIHTVLGQPPPPEVRARVVASAAAWTPAAAARLRPGRRRSWMRAGAAALVLAVAGSVAAVLVWNRAHTLVLTRHAASGDSGGGRQDSEGLPLASLAVSGIRAFVADDAPIIVANGREKPIHLGATAAQFDAGDQLHVWDWSRSPLSRVVPDVELSPWSGNVAISPDGKWLVWARGDVLNLETLERTAIDLGDETVQVGDGTYSRIAAIRFLPGGKRLALLINWITEKMVAPDTIEQDTIQVVEFPSGTPLYRVPTSEDYALRFGANEKLFATGDASRHVVLYDAASGQPRRRFEPAFKRQIMGVAVSPDGSRVAAGEFFEFVGKPSTDALGDLLIWDADSGKLLHRLTGHEFFKLGGLGPIYGELRFSPDGRYLAAESWNRIFVVDVATGKIVSSLRQDLTRTIQWSADSNTLTAIPPVWQTDGKPGQPDRDVYPSVQQWDWRSQKLIRSITEAEPPARE